MTKHYLLMFVLIGTFAIAQKQSTSNQASGIPTENAVTQPAREQGPSQSGNEIEGFRLFPNPVTDGKVFIVTKKNGVKKVIIYNVLGKVVMQKQISATYLNVDDLDAGVYIIKVTENGKTVTRKLVIK